QASGKGRWTFRLIPKIAPWLNRQHGNTNYFLTQFLTGHGSFRDFTRNIGKTEDDECVYCGEGDTAEHTVFYCPHWKQQREICQETLGIVLNPENIVKTMTDSRNNFEAINRMITQILREKEEKKDYLVNG
ncbi:MAG: hypothetical protein KTM48_02210, partial [Wolbachia endosymbiont of Pissodes strobi]|nr:hypothetical protein [Wolbachia endosymbiont of Pissodes strobi]